MYSDLLDPKLETTQLFNEVLVLAAEVLTPTNAHTGILSPPNVCQARANYKEFHANIPPFIYTAQIAKMQFKSDTI